MISAAQYVDVPALSKVLVIGLLAGAGLVAVFATGLAAAGRSADRRDGQHTTSLGAGSRVLAVACFAIAAAGVVAGLWLMLQK